jgi:hypothetical protein
MALSALLIPWVKVYHYIVRAKSIIRGKVLSKGNERNVNHSIKKQHFFFFLVSSSNFQPETAAVGFESMLLGFVNDCSTNSATVLGQQFF